VTSIEHGTAAADDLARPLANMRAVMASYPQLADFGFGIYQGYRGKPLEERLTIFERDRATLLDDRSLAQFMGARQWLRQFTKTKAVNPRAGSSYGLKHVAEADIGYVTNGVFIAAAAAEGFIVKRCRPDSPNAWFNISSRARSIGWRREAERERRAHRLGRRVQGDSVAALLDLVGEEPIHPGVRDGG